MKVNSDFAIHQLKNSKLAEKIDTKSLRAGQEDTEQYNKSLREACDGFEELFVHKLLQVMRNSSEKGDTLINGGRGEEIFQDMLDENYAKLISKKRSFGLSNLLYDQVKKS
mgnify:FL=1